MTEGVSGSATRRSAATRQGHLVVLRYYPWSAQMSTGSEGRDGPGHADSRGRESSARRHSGRNCCRPGRPRAVMSFGRRSRRPVSAACILTKSRYLPILREVRRKAGAILPIEYSILLAALARRHSGQPEFHGFVIAKELQDREGARRLTSHGTLYKALNRLEVSGLLSSRWEDPVVAADANRPRRRLYRLTGAGESALATAAVDWADTEGVTRRLASS